MEAQHSVIFDCGSLALKARARRDVVSAPWIPVCGLREGCSSISVAPRLNDDISLPNFRGIKQTINSTAFADSRYFIIVHSKKDMMQIINAHMVLVFDRDIYNRSNALKRCLSSPGEWCSLSSDINNPGTFMVEVPLRQPPASVIPQSSEVTYKCTARVWLFIVVFMCSFIFCVICVVLVYVMAVRCHFFCCAGDDYDEHVMSTEFLYLNKHTINSLQGNQKDTIKANPSTEANRIGDQTKSNQFDPVAGHSSLNFALAGNTGRMTEPSEANRYHFDASSQSICLDPESSRQQDILQMQELQLQQRRNVNRQSFEDLTL